MQFAVCYLSSCVLLELQYKLVILDTYGLLVLTRIQFSVQMIYPSIPASCYKIQSNIHKYRIVPEIFGSYLFFSK
jgi:hypothetical protein